jgi:DNA-binding IclR family transcriptional regulator
MQILDFLASAPAPATVRELARGTNLAKSTVHRLVTELQNSGLVDVEPDGYRLGLRLFELGGISLRQNRLEGMARPFMEELFASTRRLTQLGVLEGTDIIYLARVGQQGHQRVASPVAARIPATCTALGKAILAFNRGAAVAAIQDGLPRRTGYSIREPAVLEAELAEVRRSRVATEYEEVRLGLVCVASPIVVHGHVRAAISLTGPAETFDPLSAVSAITSVTRRLERALATSKVN